MSARADNLVEMVVEDLAACRPFYEGVLGCELAAGDDGVALYRFAGWFEFVLAEPGAIPLLGDTVTRNLRVFLPVPDVDSARRTLSVRTPDLPDITEGVWGRWLPLTDPSGHQIWLLEPSQA